MLHLIYCAIIRAIFIHILLTQQYLNGRLTHIIVTIESLSNLIGELLHHMTRVFVE